MPTVDLTPSQHLVLRALRRAVERDGFAPSQRELGRELGCSQQVVCRHLRALERGGWIVRRAGRARCVRLP